MNELRFRPDLAMFAENAKVTSQSQMTPTHRLRRTSIVVVVGVAVLAAVAALIVTVLSTSIFGGYSCSWFGARALASHAEFVSERVTDAYGFEVTSYDCDSGGRAFLDFKSQSAPAVARDLLLADPNCMVVEQDENDDGELVNCLSKDQLITLHFETSDATTTRGELYLERRS